MEVFSLEKQTETLLGKFIQKRFLDGFEHPLISSGIFAINSEAGFVWKTVDPFPSRLIVTKGSVYQDVNGSLAELERGHLIAELVTKLFIPVLANDHKRISKDFMVTENVDKAEGLVWSYQLEPKSEVMRKFVKQISVSGKEFTSEIKVLKTTGDKDEITLTQQQLVTQVPSNIEALFILNKE
nr:outer membrane lipoprotein carrier protein LolA [Sneathiella glossodoripedis]